MTHIEQFLQEFQMARDEVKRWPPEMQAEASKVGVLTFPRREGERAAAAPEGLTGWNLLTPEGNIAATETTCVRAWARINGYKPTVEGLLGYEEQGWRVVPATPDAAEERKPPATLRISADLKALAECVETLSHAAIFVRTREKMHPDGVEMFDRCIDKSLAVLKGRAAIATQEGGHD